MIRLSAGAGWVGKPDPAYDFCIRVFRGQSPRYGLSLFVGEGISDKFSDDPLYLKRSSETGG
ncbi:hypothetical protein NEISICOT_02488 [Neisseria sicca ATCC 29256]|uniref:Uncharacterized protein n=1 Tax=Neisseria sicca ATCC 29256 TaxID=547045 RepID=C6M7I1_NEISI|nr:hypothetical protein NEISICOT_02488 [Neisseria sicca ATCC 29256]